MTTEQFEWISLVLFWILFCSVVTMTLAIIIVSIIVSRSKMSSTGDDFLPDSSHVCTADCSTHQTKEQK